MDGASTENNVSVDLENYHVDLRRGFMLHDPLEFLPQYFDPWNHLAKNLPNLVKEKRVREAVYKMPQLDHSLLKGHKQLRLAHLQLSMIASGYVWQEGDQGVAKVLPKNIAIPFNGISQLLGIQPVLGHASLVLANWALKDANGNLRCLYHLPGEEEAEWFVTVTANVEFTFAKCLQSLLQVLQEAKQLQELMTQKGSSPQNIRSCELSLSGHLNEITSTIKAMKSALSRMHDRLSAQTFFNVLRPFLGGWGGDGNALPDGLIYEGVSDMPMKINGGSAAQSTTLQVLDALLGVEHKKGKKRDFLVQMRDFMPPNHWKLVKDLENWPYKLREIVTTNCCSELKSSYNKCVSALVDLRSYHIKIVTKYIVVASKEANEGNYESLDEKGTGGTSIIPFLQGLRTDTKECELPAKLEEVQVSLVEAKNGLGFQTRTRLLMMAAVSTLIVGIVVKHI